MRASTRVERNGSMLLKENGLAAGDQLNSGDPGKKLSREQMSGYKVGGWKDEHLIGFNDLYLSTVVAYPGTWVWELINILAATLRILIAFCVLRF